MIERSITINKDNGLTFIGHWDITTSNYINILLMDDKNVIPTTYNGYKIIDKRRTK